MESMFLIAIMFVIMYFLMIRPENKRKKQAQEMRDGLKKGDSITTIGGIIGRVVMVGTDNFVIETSDDRVRIELAKWALSNINAQTDTEKNKKEASEVTESLEEVAAPEDTAAPENTEEK